MAANEEDGDLILVREVDEHPPPPRDATHMDRAYAVEDAPLQPVIGSLASPMRKVSLDLVDLPANIGAEPVIGGLGVLSPPDVEPDRVAQFLAPRFVARR